jgi:hypothetical protein
MPHQQLDHIVHILIWMKFTEISIINNMENKPDLSTFDFIVLGIVVSVLTASIIIFGIVSEAPSEVKTSLCSVGMVLLAGLIVNLNKEKQ